MAEILYSSRGIYASDRSASSMFRINIVEILIASGTFVPRGGNVSDPTGREPATLLGYEQPNDVFIAGGVLVRMARVLEAYNRSGSREKQICVAHIQTSITINRLNGNGYCAVSLIP